MNEYVRSGRVQRARDLGADAARAAGDQDHLAAHGRTLGGACHASERYRIVLRSVYR